MTGTPPRTGGVPPATADTGPSTKPNGTLRPSHHEVNRHEPAAGSPGPTGRDRRGVRLRGVLRADDRGVDHGERTASPVRLRDRLTRKASGAGADLVLVGAGIGGAVRLTREAEEAIRTASVVLHMTAIGPELERLCPDGRVVSLMPTYEAGDDPDEVYGRIADRLVAEAELAHGHGGTAAFVTYGHPLWLVTSARSALRR